MEFNQVPNRRKIPNSHKARKAVLQEHRAKKRDALTALLHPAPDSSSSIDPISQPPSTKSKPSSRISLAHYSHSTKLDPTLLTARAASRKLQSRFITLTPAYLAAVQKLAFEDPLPRPIPASAARFDQAVITGFSDSQSEEERSQVREIQSQLTIPRRPRWKVGQTSKKELERNEQGMFDTWQTTVESSIRAWCLLSIPPPPSPSSSPPAQSYLSDNPEKDPPLPKPPSYFETNLEVYRQLWRVTEQSQIILLLLDIRCPAIHFVESMRGYLRELVYGVPRHAQAEGGRGKKGKGKEKTQQQPLKKVIIILTKSDLVDRDCKEGWVRWCKTWWRYGAEGPPASPEEEEGREEDVDVVCVESYLRREIEPGTQERHKHTPHIPPPSLLALIHSLKNAHLSLLAQESAAAGTSDTWKRGREGLKRSVDWDGLGSVGGEVVKPLVGEGGEGDFVTVGLIGQPNVGKSSLLNALLGKSKVRASKTPGKTKHFQTIFWTPEVRIVDCPGLVVPSLVGYDMQVMAGILPISQIPSLPSCIHHVAKHLPLEEIINLPPPKAWAEIRRGKEEMQGKRTWRVKKVEPVANIEEPVGEGGGVKDNEGEKSVKPEEIGEKREEWERWTAGDVMQGWAEERGFVTAKAGRPDMNRSGNALMRMVAEGKIRWGFWAPTATDEEVGDRGGRGVWNGVIEREALEDEGEERGGDEASDDDGESGEGAGEEMIEEEDEEEEEEGEEPVTAVNTRFGALAIEGDEDSEEEDDETDEDEEPKDGSDEDSDDVDDLVMAQSLQMSFDDVKKA